ncbi:TIGR03087 family PEP-CTERM/XrtA system glycosyltransferase [uncultured Piscinibacter sp.]|uniref:TIGR03087 family PEP-CTERM/XrtA system glycosyltransferase n=1 Tax=uncultured Piscinibacter sp. TaxID=1131835 RepID=UPI0026260883|nr:TIGR03087 family PEP-CTERM/XrtA system glycosyltransferase [uncultured Piscinibacter sp.]
MRILFLSHRFPYPPTFGSKVRAFHVIRHLSREHEVTVLSLVRSDQELAEAAGIAGQCHAFEAIRVHDSLQTLKMAAALPSRWTASEAYFHSAALSRALQRRLNAKSFDFAFAHCSAVGRYLEQARGLPKLIDFCDVDSQKWLDYTQFKRWPLSWGYRWEGMRLAAAERRIAARFDAVTVATAGEMDVLHRMGVRERVDWFANGVDAAFFSPDAEPYDQDLISFVGRMDYFPNEQCMEVFCAEVLPLLQRERPALRLQIVGAAPTARVKALTRHVGVTVTGSVPDIRRYVRRSAVTVAPLKIARGTQNKILESMAMGVPVVCSTVAARGVDAVPGEHLLAADSPHEVCSAVLRLVGDRAERARLSEAGRARVLTHHGWEAAMQRLDGIVARSVSRGACENMVLDPA